MTVYNKKNPVYLTLSLYSLSEGSEFNHTITSSFVHLEHSTKPDQCITPYLQCPIINTVTHAFLVSNYSNYPSRYISTFFTNTVCSYCPDKKENRKTYPVTCV